MRTYHQALQQAGVGRGRQPVDLRRGFRWPVVQSWAPDMPQAELAPGIWTELKGVRQVEAGLERWRDILSVLEGLPLAYDGGRIVYTDVGNVPMFVGFGEAGAWRIDGTARYAMTGGPNPQRADFHQLSGEVFNGFGILNDPSTAPHYYANGANGDQVEPLPGWPGLSPTYDWQAGVVRGFREFLLAIGMTESGAELGDRLRWSDQASAGAMPTTWSPAPENLAGFIDLTSEGGDLVDGAELGGDAFGLYKTDATYTLDYVGAPYVFRARRISALSGLASRNAVARVPFGNVLWTGEDLVLNDGQALRSILAPQLRRWVGRNVNPDRIEDIQAYTHPQRREVWFLLPLGAELVDPSGVGLHDILAWDWERDAWSHREVSTSSAPDSGVVHFVNGYVPDPEDRPIAWETDSEAWDDDPTPWNRASPYSANAVVYLANRVGLFGQVDATNGGDYGDPNQSSSQARLLRESWDLGEPRRRKTVTGLRLLWDVTRAFNGVPTTQVRFGTQDNLAEPIAWGNSYLVDYATDGETRLDVPSSDAVHGRYISMELIVDLPQPWAFSGLELEVRMDGRYVQPKGTNG